MLLVLERVCSLACSLPEFLVVHSSLAAWVLPYLIITFHPRSILTSPVWFSTWVRNCWALGGQGGLLLLSYFHVSQIRRMIFKQSRQVPGWRLVFYYRGWNRIVFWVCICLRFLFVLELLQVNSSLVWWLQILQFKCKRVTYSGHRFPLALTNAVCFNSPSLKSCLS